MDEFRKYLEKRGQDAQSLAETTQSSGTKTRRGRTGGTNGDTNQQAKHTKNDLDDALSDLNRSTNRLRRKFDPASDYIETWSQMEKVMDSAHRVSKEMVRGNYGPQAERYWTSLRADINDLARCYGLVPMSA